ncbi:MAG TPA: DNA polymerase III subunit alpha [Vicinamibacterales bacterium]|jgi:DNA polymerase-3 subunit alpha|nr:DNA polymerase III subunit alpha [Vicinamibacterales bacterium]
MPEFVHLHLHSEYSLLDGACRIEELLDKAVELKMPAMAITEHGNMFSSVVFHDQARKRGINPILGCEVYVAPGDRRTKSGTPGETANHLVLLAETIEGYRNLIKLVSSGYTEGFYYKPRIDKDLLAQHAKGLIGLSSCLKGEVATGIRTEQQHKAVQAAATYRDILGRENFFLEMQFQGIEEQKLVNVGVQPIAKDLGLDLVITNDVHYLHDSDYKPHDILLCIGTGKTVNDADRLRYHGDQFFLKTPEQMAAVFPDHLDALARTVRIAERCSVDLSFTENYLPNFAVPEGFTLDNYFEHIVRQGFEMRLPKLRELAAKGALKHPLDEYERRLAYEIDMIEKMKYPGYFCIVWDFIRYAREQGIPVGPGRGSAAGSFVAYCLRITDVDPIEYDLIFERFLNPERVSLPDIDIDFCERRRGEVIEYVTRKYGREQVAQIITFGTMKARAVVRDVARVMDIPYADADKVAKAVPPALDMTLEKALAESPPLKEMEQKDDRIKELLAVARRLEGMTRHASVHAAGVVIAPRPLTEFVPLYKSQKDEIVTQWAMKEVERVGLLKMDFLGLSTLTLIRDCLDEIKRTDGLDLDIDAIPLNDGKTYKLFADGQTYGVFQFESSGMRELLRKAKPERLDDLIALNALYRPGPLKSGMVDDFISRKQGKTEVKYELPQLAPILGDTYGVIAYQEQVMRIAAVLAGFTMGQSDVLRKAMGKKDPRVMAKQREAFMEGAAKHNVNEKKAKKIFDLMEFFAGYGFNKSHSTTYAWVAYQTAYLKANYPSHFMAALLTIEAANTDKLAMYLGECRELGIPILPPDINTSRLAFTVEGAGTAQPSLDGMTPPNPPVRFGLCAVKNVGEGAILSMLNVREQRGQIESLFALCEEVDQRLVNKRPLESLVKAGAFDGLAEGPIPMRRARLFAAIDKAIEHGGRHQRNRDEGMVSFFDLTQDDEPPAAIPLPDAPAWTEAQQLAFEKESLGLYMSGHPLERFSEDLKAFGAQRVGDLAASLPDVWVGGIVSGLRPLKTKKGDRMCVFMLDDIGGSIEVVVFPETFGRFGALVAADAMVLARGKFEKDDESARLVASELMPISALRERTTREVAIHLAMPPHSRATLEALAELFSRHRGDRRVSLELDVKNSGTPMRVKADVAQRVRPSEKLVEEVEHLCGAGSVELR